MWQNIIIAQADPQGSVFVQLLPFLLIFGVFWFLVIRPQQKRQKAHEAVLGSLKKDDAVITSGGILGTIEKVDGQVLTLRVSRDTKIKVLRTQIEGIQGTLLTGGDDAPAKEIEDKSSDDKSAAKKNKKTESDEESDDSKKNW